MSFKSLLLSKGMWRVVPSLLWGVWGRGEDEIAKLQCVSSWRQRGLAAECLLPSYLSSSVLSAYSMSVCSLNGWEMCWSIQSPQPLRYLGASWSVTHISTVPPSRILNSKLCAYENLMWVVYFPRHTLASLLREVTLAWDGPWFGLIRFACLVGRFKFSHGSSPQTGDRLSLIWPVRYTWVHENT